MGTTKLSLAKVIVSIFILVSLVTSILIASTSYFNHKEIRALSSGCIENNGELELVITNELTNAYTFTCHGEN